MATQNCPRCAGTGKWNYRYECFRCNGLGKILVLDKPAADRVGSPVSTNVERISTAMATALKNGILHPKMRLGDFKFSLAGANSRNHGAIYVKGDEAKYLGKIQNGIFYASAQCEAREKTEILRLVADPLESSIAYGRKTGICGICGITLTNKVSIARGIGPICAGKYGWTGIFTAEEVERDIPSVEIPDDLDMDDVSVLGVK